MIKASKVVMFIGIVVAFGPLAIAFLSIPISLLMGCMSVGGSPGVCVVGGSVMGKFVWTMAMMHWYSLLTFFPGMGIVLLGVVIAILSKILQRKNDSAADHSSRL
jgi:hypothetical protein